MSADACRTSSRRGATLRRRTAIVSLAVLVFAGLVFVAVTHPQMKLYNEDMRLTADARTFEQVMWIHNAGPTTQQVSAVASGQRGVSMIGTNAVGKRVSPGHTTRIKIFYRAVDCQSILHGPHPRGGAFPVHVEFGHWWRIWRSSTFFDQGGPFGGDAVDACLPRRHHPSLPVTHDDGPGHR